MSQNTWQRVHFRNKMIKGNRKFSYSAISCRQHWLKLFTLFFHKRPIDQTPTQLFLEASSHPASNARHARTHIHYCHCQRTHSHSSVICSNAEWLEPAQCLPPHQKHWIGVLLVESSKLYPQITAFCLRGKWS